MAQNDTSPSPYGIGLPREFTIVDADGVQWSAMREPLGNGIFRTPDDPTTLEDLITRQISDTRANEICEQVEQEFPSHHSSAS